jgi:hypothetical protein
MDREFSDELTALMPRVLHGITGVNCSGRVVAVVEGTSVELRCDKCGAVVGVVQVGIMEGLLGLDCAGATCPYCGKVNTFPGCGEVVAYVCAYCNKSVGM